MQKVRRYPRRDSDRSKAPGFRIFFTSLITGSLSPFPHGTLHYRFLRVCRLGRWSSPLPSGAVSRCTHFPVYTRWYDDTGLSPSLARGSTRFSPYIHHSTREPGPRSLAATDGISVDVFSSRYLDVSLHWVYSRTVSRREIHGSQGVPSPRRFVVSNVPCS